MKRVLQMMWAEQEASIIGIRKGLRVSVKITRISFMGWVVLNK